MLFVIGCDFFWRWRAVFFLDTAAIKISYSLQAQPLHQFAELKRVFHAGIPGRGLYRHIFRVGLCQILAAIGRKRLALGIEGLDQRLKLFSGHGLAAGIGAAGTGLALLRAQAANCNYRLRSCYIRSWIGWLRRLGWGLTGSRSEERRVG